MNHNTKMAHNLQLLTTATETPFIYIPVQFGHLSSHLYRVKVIDQFAVLDGSGIKTYKVLELLNSSKMETRYILWWHKEIHKGIRGRVYEYSFERYTKKGLDKLRKTRCEPNREEEELEKSNESQNIFQAGQPINS